MNIGNGGWVDFGIALALGILTVIFCNLFIRPRIEKDGKP